MQLWPKMATLIKEFADIAYLRTANQPPVVYPEVAVVSAMSQ